MADSKISLLPSLATAADDDLLAIVDTSATETKKIAKSNLVAGLQAELVSGTNIKTINSTSLLGSGDIAISANPAGTAGQIQFNSSSAFGADSNLFWDNTNKRLGVGTATPSTTIQSLGGFSFGGQNSLVYVKEFADRLQLSGSTSVQLSQNVVVAPIGSFVSPLGSFHVRGTGSTSATTSLLVQNSAGTGLFTLKDNGEFVLGGASDFGCVPVSGCQFRFSLAVGTLSLASASAILQADSTTRGFLPPRMTTTQKNAISTPAAGLQVYDSTTNRAAVYSTAWENVITETNGSPNSVYKLWSGSAAQYAALTPDSSTLYFVI